MKYFFFLNTSHTAQNNCVWTLIKLWSCLFPSGYTYAHTCQSCVLGGGSHNRYTITSCGNLLNSELAASFQYGYSSISYHTALDYQL